MTAPATADVDVRQRARRHRDRLGDVVFIAVTGSCGKTTTKNLIAAVLAGRYQGAKSSGSNNCGTDIAADLLTVRPDDRYFVQELGAWGAGTLDAGIDLIRPDIAVVTNLRNDHYSAFHGPRGAQAEKGKLVTHLPATGAAVLNWDDPYVRELAANTTARVVSVGRDSAAELRAVNVTACWPQSLSFDAVHGHDRMHVQTRLLGEHLLGSALAALAVGLVLDVPLAEAADRLAAAEPTPRRMSQVTHPDGVTFVRDDFKAPIDSIPEALTFLRQSTAGRTIAVLGRISDFPGRSRRTYTEIARHAARAVDTVVFVGERAAQLWGDQRGTTIADQRQLRGQLDLPEPQDHPRGDIFVFATVAQASTFLTGYLHAGDLVLLKGSGPTDHLERILLHRQQPNYLRLGQIFAELQHQRREPVVLAQLDEVVDKIE